MSSRYEWCMKLSPAASAKITAYRPRQAPPEWEQVADRVRMLVAASAHMSPYNVERLLHVTARLAIWCHRQGMAHDPEVWLRHETIDAFVLAGCTDLAPRSAQTYRAWLRRMRATLAWIERGERVPPALKAPADRSAPYSPTHLARLRSWAENLTGQARSDALALMGLAVGCGLAPGELAAIRGEHVRPIGSGAVVVDASHLGRLIVARATWEQHLAEAAALAGDRYLFRPRRTTTYAKNLINSWSTRHRPTSGLPTLSVRRLRASWIVELLSDRIDPAVVAAAAGLTSPALARYQHFVPPLDEETATALLRGRP
ncbi:hypothetical protein SAMN05216275_1158 [Streptosporangium canum]|uniref:Tyr recombinase domain-containing protein n=1 Tax=Streptosporangium canum TaxID=324952 RepID=A0A1I3VWF3_9ACTN|nr:hypothetical protein SAMN05216275_1158 [Streptosporangium canum]